MMCLQQSILWLYMLRQRTWLACLLTRRTAQHVLLPGHAHSLHKPVTPGAGTASKRGSSWAGDLVQQDSSLPFIQVDSNALRVSMNGSEGLLQDIQEILQRPARTSLAGQAEGVVL